MFLLAAISLGFLGSLHCIGMCGPIALALPVKNRSFTGVFKTSLLYNLGRASTYSVLGFLFGVLGQGFALAGLQGPLSIGIGLVLLVYVLVTYYAGKGRENTLLTRALQPVRSHIAKLFNSHAGSSLFFIGLLNGLLPCGLVYLGIAGAVATGSALQGAAFMAVFGLGTFPAMFAVGLARNSISLRFRERARKLVPVFACAMALLLVIRGLGLGIPYISPSVHADQGRKTMECCKKQ